MFRHRMYGVTLHVADRDAQLGTGIEFHVVGAGGRHHYQPQIRQLCQLVAGQAVRQAMVRAPLLFKAGAQVKVVAQGPGYAVSSAGQALTAGSAGQTVRVRMENGRIVSGTVNDSGTVDVTL